MGLKLILVIFEAITLVKSDIQRWDNGFLASFEIINIGRMYKTMKPALYLDVYACAVECIRQSDCVTINHNHEKDLCELVDREYDEMEASTSDPDWANYGTPNKIDGNFSPWKKGSICSQTCGRDSGSPIDGKFSAWQKVGACSVTCEIGTQMEQRSCDNPQPRYGGKPCQGIKVRKVECNTNVPCPIDGSWSAWTANGVCSSCTKVTRTCQPPLSIKYNHFSCLKLDNVTRDMTETKMCKPCNISDYVKCEFRKNLNINSHNYGVLRRASSEKHCIEFCYLKKKHVSRIVAALMIQKNNDCFCKAGKMTTPNGEYKICLFEEVDLVHLRKASQSSTLFFGFERVASLAVDGTGEYSSTKDEKLSWWSVEADSSFFLQKIYIRLSTNRHLYKSDIVVKVKTAQNEPWEYCFQSRYSRYITQTCKDKMKTIKFIRIECSGQLVLHTVEIFGWPSYM